MRPSTLANADLGRNGLGDHDLLVNCVEQLEMSDRNKVRKRRCIRDNNHRSPTSRSDSTSFSNSGTS